MKIVDSWWWIFKDLKEKGYVICFLEDLLGIVVFNYCLNGFWDFFIDYYGRLFWMEVDKFLRVYCVNSWVFYNVFFEYLLSFFCRYRDWLRFVFVLYCEIFYDDINMIGYVDDDLKIFFDEFEKELFLDNIMLIIFSDYGVCFLNLRKIF